LIIKYKILIFAIIKERKEVLMAKDKVFELNYKIEGLKRMMKRKVKRGLKNRYKSVFKEKQRNINDEYFDRW
jgi:hypothetical protein